MRFLLGSILGSVLIFSCSDSGRKVGGPCHYKTREFKAIGLGWDDDEHQIFRFKSLVNDQGYGLDSLDMLDHGLSVEDLQKDGQYKLVINEITDGSCVPFVIKDIKIL